MTSFEDRRAGGREAVVPSPGDHRARAATALVFFLTGFVVAAWATRIPAVQERLGLSPGTFALAVAGLEAGALAGLPAGGALVARLGSRPCLRLGFAVYPTALPGVALAPGLAWLAAALAVMAAANSVVDVAMDAQGIELERRYRRPILSGLHAAHPFGMLAGGLGGTTAAAAGLAVLPHFAMAAATRLAPPVAVAAVTTLGYLGSFTGPPVIGALAELTGLSAALGLLVAAALVVVPLAGRALGQPSLR